MNKITIRQLAASTLSWLAACIVVALASKAAYAQGTPNKLESIDVQNISGQQMQLTLHHSAPPSEPVAFTIDNPARISLDLANTALALPSRRIDVRSGGLDSILAAEASGRTRLVLNLDRLLPYTTRVSGNDVIILVGGASAPVASAAASSSVAGSSAPQASASAAPSGPRAIRGIDFRRGAGGTGRVIVKLSDPRTPVSLRQLGNQIVVDFAGAEVASNLARRYDAADFATPVTGFDVVRVGDGVRLAISASGDFEQLAYQSDDQYVVEVQPARKAQQKSEEKRIYTGERLTLNFQDIETRAVLQLLADASGQNIVVSDSVSGSVTLRLQNVPWDQALDIVLRTKGLDKRRTDNVIIVAPTEELAAREKAELAARADVQDLAPLRTEYMQVNYAKASDLAALIKTQGVAGGLLSKRGTVSVDERTNTLLLQDSADRLDDIRRLVGTLDIPIRQVQIEARIVIVSDDFSRDLGARLGFSGFDFFSNNLGYTSGSALANDQAISDFLERANDTDPLNDGVPFVFSQDGTTAPQRYNVNLPVASPAGSLAFMVLGSDYLVDLELSAAEAEGRGEVISTPRVITANQREAMIEQGTEIPYQESASSGATTISFKKAVLSLKVTPQVTPDNRIILDLTVKKDSVGQIIVGGAGQQVPSIDTRTITTQVLVNDGQTVVLGGILETERRETEKKVPYLGDVPVLGRLFKTTGKTNNKDELLIFVTPKILREGVSVY
jgi:type IV pilus assembly protein PilQ